MTTESFATERAYNSISDYEAAAREILPAGLFPVLFGSYGEEGWEANTRNLDGLSAVQLQPRVMVDVSELDLTTTVLGTPISVPIVTGPAGLHLRFNAEGEIGTATGTAAAGSLIVLSTAASYSIEEIAELNAGPRWFQLYCFKNRELTAGLVHRAEASGYEAIVLTVDNPGVRSRERDHRHGFDWHGGGQVNTLDPDRILRHFHGLEGPGIPNGETFHQEFETALDWRYFDWLREQTELPFVVKGVQTVADALLAAEHGARALVVSNHGGHALHDTVATVETLPEIVDAVGSDVEVYVDGGIRRGLDVLKCLALGARAVLIGRAYLWPVTVDGAAGVQRAYALLRDELEVAMAYCGISDVKQVPRTLVHRAGERDIATQLLELADLVDRGHLSSAEYHALKNALISAVTRRSY